MSEHRDEEDGGSSPTTEPSGEPSQDSVLDPAELFAVVEHDENVNRILDAMEKFLRYSDAQLLERAVAVYVRSARARAEPVEAVLGTLQVLADRLERDAPPGFTRRDTPLRHLVLRGVLLAFYGEEVVRREAIARQDRLERRKVAPGESPSPGTPQDSG